MDAGLLLFRLLALLVAARLAAELAEKLKLPAVLVEITAGLVLGPSILGFVGHDPSLRFLGELGAIFLLLEVGLHMDLADLRRVGRAALQVAVVGVVLPLVAGTALMRAIGVDPQVALFLGAGITATSVGITARVFADMRALATGEAQTVLGAAVADDVIGLLILTVVTRLADSGTVEAGSIVLIAVTGVMFVIGATAIGSWLAPIIFDRLVSRARTEGTLIGAAVAFTLAVAGLAAAARLAPIVGAFVAGLALGRIKEQDDLRQRLTPVVHLFVPVFFLLIGAEASVGALAEPGALTIVGVLGLVAVVSKVVAGYAIRRGSADRLLIGIGMIPRGEVGVVFATLGLAGGVLHAREHAALLTVVLATTLVAPPLLRHRIERGRRTALQHAVDNAPSDGWLVVTLDEVDLRAEPPFGLAPTIGLEASVLCAQRRPSQRLLEWLSRASGEPPVWDEHIRGQFFKLLRDGDPRSWRLLDVTGLMQLLMPELDAEMRRRKQDPFDLDPAGALRWEEVEAVKALAARGDDPAARLWSRIDQNVVLVAALARSAFRRSVNRTERESARQLSMTLGFDIDQTAIVAFLTSERDLLAAAAARLSIGTEESVLELATHIRDRARADVLYFMTAAITTDQTRRKALDELYGLITTALAHPDLTGAEATDLVEARKEEVIRAFPRVPDPDARKLIDAAPRRYLLVHTPETIARHVRMLEPPPTRNEVKLHADPDLEHGRWTVHVVTLDRPGVFAAIARGFATCQVPILEAWISTWTNGVVVDVFTVAASRDVDFQAVQDAIIAAFSGGNNGSSSAIEGSIELDNVASPWHTIVEVRAKDRGGLLYRVGDAFARTGIDIHHAAVRTIDGIAVDAFLVTDRNGHKLDARAEKALREAFEGRFPGRWDPLRVIRRAPARPTT